MKNYFLILLCFLAVSVPAGAATVLCEGQNATLFKNRFEKMEMRALQIESGKIFQTLRSLMGSDLFSIDCSGDMAAHDQFALTAAACLQAVAAEHKSSKLAKIQAHPDYARIISLGGNYMATLNANPAFELPVSASCYDTSRREHAKLLTDNVDLSAALYVISELE